MPKIEFRKAGEIHSGEVPPNSNLVVRAGVRQFPFPHLRYECGMGKCTKCACRVISGGEQLPPPNWKERKLLGANLDRGYRLMCQLWIQADITLEQDVDDVWSSTIQPSSNPAQA